MATATRDEDTEAEAVAPLRPGGLSGAEPRQIQALQGAAGNSAVVDLLAARPRPAPAGPPPPPAPAPAPAPAPTVDPATQLQAGVETSTGAGPAPATGTPPDGPAPGASAVAPERPAAPPVAANPLSLPEAPTPHQAQALAQIRTSAEEAGARLDGALADRLAESEATVEERLAALDATTTGRASGIRADAETSRAEVRSAADADTARLTQSAAANTAATEAWHTEAVTTADAALLQRQDAIVASGQERADQAGQQATDAAETTRSDAQSLVQEAHGLGEEKAASASGGDAAVQQAEAAAARELSGDTSGSITTAADDAAAGMQVQGTEVATGLQETADQVATDLGGHREGMVGHLGEQHTRTVGSLADTAGEGGRAIAERRDGSLAAIDRNEADALTALHDEAATQAQAIVDAGQEAAEHLTTATTDAGLELTRDVEQAGSVFASQPVDEETSAAVADDVRAQLGPAVDQLDVGLTTRTDEMLTGLGSAADQGTAQLDSMGDQAGTGIRQVGDQGAGALHEAASATEAGLAATVDQTRIAGDSALSSFDGVLDQNLTAAESGLDGLLDQHEGALGDQSAEVRARSAEPTVSLGNRIDVAQQRAAERAERSWLENQLADLWETVNSREFLVGLLVGLAVGAIIILSAGTATPFVVMAAGIAAGAAGAAAGTMSGNAKAGKTGWDLLDNVGTNALIGGLAGGIGAGIFLFGGGVAAGLGLSGTGAAVFGFATLEVAAVVSNTVANVAAGEPWDKNLLTAILLAPLIDFIAARIPGLKGGGSGDEPPVIRPEDPNAPRRPAPPPEEGPTPIPDEDGPVPVPDDDGPVPGPDEDRPNPRPAEIPEGVTNEDVHIEDLHEPARRPGDPELDPAICFPAGTLVATPGGDRRIEEIEAGSPVLAYDFATGEVVTRPVLGVVRGSTTRWTDVGLDGETVRSTPSHRFWVESTGAWLMADELEVGMTVRRRDGGVATVTAVSGADPDEPEETFNLSVEDAENYFVGALGVLVHNITATRMAYLRRPGYQNYVLRDAAGAIYYSGMCRPGENAAGLARRHGANHNRFNAANGDVVEFLPGTREYGESRLLEHRTAVENDTIIGRDGENFRGNRQDPVGSDKMPEYLEYEQVRAGCG